MRHTKPPVFASVELGLVALHASDIIFPNAIANKTGLAAEIAIRLSAISEQLQQHELYEITPIAQDLSLQALRDLLRICKWTEKPNTAAISPYQGTPRELREILIRSFSDEKSVEKVRKSVTKFCNEKPDVIDPFRSRFVQLSEALSLKEGTQYFLSLSGNTQHNGPPEEDVYPSEAHEVLIRGVKDHALCIEVHEHALLDSDRHVTQLCLNSGVRFQDQQTRFDIVTANSSKSYWQEITIFVQVGVAQRPSPNKMLVKGTICKWLESPNYAKIHLDLDDHFRFFKRPGAGGLEHIISGGGIKLSDLLQQSSLTVEHKIKLSHAIARAFWKFHDSDILGCRWTSEDLVFIAVDPRDSAVPEVPLRPFVSMPFTQKKDSPPAEMEENDLYTHAYPHVLHLGIILLEIGIGRPLGSSDNTGLDFVANTNLARTRAHKKMKDLKMSDWGGFHGKDLYIRIIENCLDSFVFKDSAGAGKLSGQDQKNILYQKVVKPLSWLATVGFDDGEDMPLVQLQQEVARHENTSTDHIDFDLFLKEIGMRGTFRTDSRSTECFFQDLKSIAAHVLRQRSAAHIHDEPIKLAILDTGCDVGLPFFEDGRRLGQLRRWKDFSEHPTEAPSDDFGHGSLMTKLIMEIAPMVDIYLVRIATNNEQLEKSEENIAKAIELVGLHPDWKVDMVSMSYGFSRGREKENKVISEAIDKVTSMREGTILFLASAGNARDRREDFPACHPGVISIHAADADRRPSGFNPGHTSKHSRRLFCHGTDIPPSIVKDVQEHFPGRDFSAGTSIATAIAAGITATTLSYVSALPTLVKCTGAKDVCARIFTKRGMELLFYAMSTNIGHHEHFISPKFFWGERLRAMDVFATICSVDNELRQE